MSRVGAGLEGVNELEAGVFPSFEEGTLRPLNKMSRYLEKGAAGEVRPLLHQGFDLPGRAESKVALHLLNRQIRRHFQQGEFPSSHHREEGWPSDQENTAQHPLFARTGWCSDRTDKEHHPGGVDKEAARHFLGDAATAPRGDARRGIRFFQNDTSKPHMFSWPLWTRVRTISSKQLGQL